MGRWAHQEVGVWFRRKARRAGLRKPSPPSDDGRLVLRLDEELLARLRQAACAGDQPTEVLAVDLLARSLEQAALRGRAQAALEVLTPREREVVHLAARGWTNLQIAESLVVSPETVKTHVRHALEKFGLRSKTELRLFLLDLGIRWWDQEPPCKVNLTRDASSSNM